MQKVARKKKVTQKASFYQKTCGKSSLSPRLAALRVLQEFIETLFKDDAYYC